MTEDELARHLLNDDGCRNCGWSQLMIVLDSLNGLTHNNNRRCNIGGESVEIPIEGFCENWMGDGLRKND